MLSGARASFQYCVFWRSANVNVEFWRWSVHIEYDMHSILGSELKFVGRPNLEATGGLWA